MDRKPLIYGLGGLLTGGVIIALAMSLVPKAHQALAARHIALLGLSPTNLHVASAASVLAALFAVFATSVRRREVAAQRARLTP